MLQRQAERFGNRPLFVAGHVRWTFAETASIAACYAGALGRAGIRAGDRVALMCSNRAEFMQAFLGCVWLGAIAVPINVASRGMQLRHILENSGARLLIVETELLDAWRALDPASGAIEQVWTIGRPPALPLPAGVTSMAFPDAAEPAPPGKVGPGDTAAILYTSGTTGASKGVCCPQAQFYWWGVHTSQALGIGQGDVLTTTLPLFHTNALNSFYQALLTGATLVVERRFSASTFWADMARHRATVTYLLGAMVPILLSRPLSPDDRAHRARIALAPGVPAQFHDAFVERFGTRLIDGYGSTETNFVIGADLGRPPPGSMGSVRPGFEARVVDEHDEDLPDGQAGELVLRATQPYAFATGYFAMHDKTVEAWRNLWFHTGDRVVRDAGGNFRFVDRLKDAIRRRGENVSSFEVEQVLLSHPDVETAAVYPVRSELAEDEVMAAVVLRAGATLAALDLVRFCEKQMPYFAVPRFVEFVDALPVTENGKVQKFKLRERGITEHAWDREAAGYQVKR